MVMMSCDDMNKFLYVCVVFASRIHKFNICNVNASGYKWFLWLASQDLEKFHFIGGTPRKGQLVMGVVAAACLPALLPCHSAPARPTSAGGQ